MAFQPLPNGLTVTNGKVSHPIGQSGTYDVRVKANASRNAGYTARGVFTTATANTTPAAPTFTAFDDTADTVTLVPASGVPMSEYRWYITAEGAGQAQAVPANGVINFGDMEGSVTAYSIASGTRNQSPSAASPAFTVAATAPVSILKGFVAAPSYFTVENGELTEWRSTTNNEQFTPHSAATEVTTTADAAVLNAAGDVLVSDYVLPTGPISQFSAFMEVTLGSSANEMFLLGSYAQDVNKLSFGMYTDPTYNRIIVAFSDNGTEARVNRKGMQKYEGAKVKIGFTYDAGEMTLYVSGAPLNGENVTEPLAHTSLFGNGLPLTIGGSLHGDNTLEPYWATPNFQIHKVTTKLGVMTAEEIAAF